jgi:glycosyltransferase involved in cell wall biosynthesis
MRTQLQQNGVNSQQIRLIHKAVEVSATGPAGEAVELRKRHRIRTGQKVIGVVGRLSREKGQMVFLEALSSVSAAYPDVKALVIGDGPDQRILETFCQERNLREFVEFTGYCEDIRAYYQVLDLLVLPSLSEGLPNTVLEAMSWGVPVLATRVGGVPEVIDSDNGVLVPPGDPASLAAGMLKLLRDDALRVAIAARGQRSLHPRFAPEQRALRLLSVYDELLPQSRATRATTAHA